MFKESLEEELINEFNWRIQEISVIRTFQFSQNINEYQKEVYLKHSFVALYALWEGFVNSSFSLYVEYINRLKLNYNELHISIITNDMDNKFNTGNFRPNFDNRSDFLKKIFAYINTPVILTAKIPTKYNINFKAINNILKIFNIDAVNSPIYKIGLDRLVIIRNNIAHGNFTIPIQKELFNDSCQVIIDLMAEIINKIIDSYEKRTYLNSHVSK